MIPLDHPLILVLAGAIVPTVLGILAYRRGAKADKAAERSAIEAHRAASVAQVIQGLEGLIDSLQEDNKVLRLDVRRCAVKLEQVIIERDQLKEEIKKLIERA